MAGRQGRTQAGGADHVARSADVVERKKETGDRAGARARAPTHTRTLTLDPRGKRMFFPASRREGTSRVWCARARCNRRTQTGKTAGKQEEKEDEEEDWRKGIERARKRKSFARDWKEGQ